jgi:hypothetical protein
MKRHHKLLAGAIGVVIVFVALIAPAHFVYWRSESAVETFLSLQTPIGSSQQEVLSWLRSEGLKPALDGRTVPPKSDYPLSEKGGASFIAIKLNEYWWVWNTQIEGFYTFDAQGRLHEIRVRRSTDSF